MVGSFSYLTANKLDIMYFVFLCAQVHATPTELHKYKFKYWIGMSKFDLCYLKILISCDVIGYSNVEFTSYKVYMKTTLGIFQFL